MAYVQVDVDLDEFDDQELIDELEYRGWIVGEEKGREPLVLRKEDLDFIRNVIVKYDLDQTIDGRRLYDKILSA